ncbi:MAG: MerR family transcriptional regulator [Planctomycetes bacterium]|nr:MerR family transcriptional regulator [Planctomycetota bacterium]
MLNQSRSFSIGTVTSMLGLSASTIRRYEREGRLSFVPNRRPNGQREYSEQQVLEIQELSKSLRRKSQSNTIIMNKEYK